MLLKGFWRKAQLATGIAASVMLLAPQGSWAGQANNKDVVNGIASVRDADKMLASSDQGSATLKADDLRTLLSAIKGARDSSVVAPNQPDVIGAYHLSISLSDIEINALLEVLDKIAHQRKRLVAENERVLENNRERLLKQRHAIQIQRTSSGAKNEGALNKALFENILMEANLKAQIETDVANFDDSNAIGLEFVMLKGKRQITGIEIGSSEIWSLQHGLSMQGLKTVAAAY